MTDRRELERLAEILGASCAYDRDGRLETVTLRNGMVYGTGPRSLVGFAEAFRHLAPRRA